MSADIAAWLNDHATATGLPAVPLVGMRPTGRPLVIGADPNEAASALRARWPDVAVLRAGEVWRHKGGRLAGGPRAGRLLATST